MLARFDDWFSYDTVVLTDVAGDDVGDRVLVHYKLMFDPDADRRVLTQTVVCTLRDGLVGRMDLVCTGFGVLMTQPRARALDHWGDYDRDCWQFPLFDEVRAAGQVQVTWPTATGPSSSSSTPRRARR